MKYYCVAEMKITDPSWVQDYVQNVTGMVERHGGRYLTRTNRIEQIEGAGQCPQVMLVIEWPSREAIDAFYESEEYRPYREARERGAESRFFVMPAEDSGRRAQIGKE
jgi:uncharacterized protein (DUF1330 family)